MSRPLRILFATTSGAGHFGPLVPFATACVAAGHTVAVAAPQSLAAVVARAGFAHLPFDDAPTDELGAVFGSLRGATNHEGNVVVVREVFGRIGTRCALPGMRTIAAEWRPDVIVRETCEFSSYIVAEANGVPHLQVAVSLAGFDRDYLPVVVEPLGDLGATHVETLWSATRFTLVPESFDDPDVTGVAPTFRFRDQAAVTAGSGVAPLPDWWTTEAADPLVYVSFGTVAPTLGLYPALYRAVIDSLADVPVRVLVTIGEVNDPEDLEPLPSRVHVERWWPQREVMPHVAAMVGHGGFGSTLAGLAAGRPLVLVPLFADQPYNAARVQAVGAGIALEGGAAAAGQVGEAVRVVIQEASYAEAAGRIAADIAALPPVSEALRMVEEMAG